MAIRMKCSGCQAGLSVPDELQGKQIRCPKCNHSTQVLGEPSAAAPPVPTSTAPAKTQPARSSEGITKSLPPPVARAGARKTHGDEDDEERRSPKARGRARDDEDSEDRPRQRKKQKKAAFPWIWVGAGGGGVAVVAVVLVVLLSRGSSTVKPIPAPVALANAGLANAAQANEPQASVAAEQPESKPVPIPAGKAPDKIEPETTQKVKKATAFLNVRFANGRSAQGSGFFAAEKGLVFTNAHVLGMLKSSVDLPTEVEVIVNSGESDEFSRPCRVLGVDQESDLGVLRIEDTSGLPDPLPVDTTRGLIELQEVYVFGFPFGSSLGKNITVSKSSVSSLRKDAHGNVYQVQVNGGMNPGNSGGPVVDSRGVVIGVAVSGIQGTGLNFAVPGDMVQELLRGRVASVSPGESYLRDGKTKVMVELSSLDPMNRLRDIKLEVWAGSHGPARPTSLQPPTASADDGPRLSTPVVFQNNKAKTEIELPPLAADQAFWLQPVLSDKSGGRSWGSAVAYKMADYVPLERKPVLLQYQFDTQAERTIKFGNVYRDSKSVGGKTIAIAVNLEMEAVENSQKDARGGQTRVFSVNSRITAEVDGKPSPQTPNIQTLSLFKGKSFSFATDAAGSLQRRTIPALLPPNPPNLRFEFEDFAMDFSNAYEMTLISLPNRQVQPKESWQCKVPFFLNSYGKKKEVVDMHLTCTLEGVRSADGQSQALISVAGNIMRRQGAKASAGKITGKVHFAIDKGYLSQVKLKKEATGGDNDSGQVEVVLTRSAGNTTGETPPPLPPPPVPLAKGKTIFQDMNLLGPADVANYPTKPGCHYKVYRVNLYGGKTYVIEMNKTDESMLDPFLILHSPLNQKLMEDDDSGGNLNARIVFRAPANGTYLVIATTMAPNMTGQYQVTVSEAAGTPKAPLPKKSFAPKGKS